MVREDYISLSKQDPYRPISTLAPVGPILGWDYYCTIIGTALAILVWNSFVCRT